MCEALEYIKSVIANFSFLSGGERKKSGVSIKIDANKPNRPVRAGMISWKFVPTSRQMNHFAIGFACRIPAPRLNSNSPSSFQHSRGRSTAMAFVGRI